MIVPTPKTEEFTTELTSAIFLCMFFYYQVIEGGDLDVNFLIQSPSGRVLLSELRKTDGVHRFVLSIALSI